MSITYMPAMNKWNLKLKAIQHALAPHPKKKYYKNLTKYIQALVEENYKSLMNEIREDLNKWWDSPYLCTERKTQYCQDVCSS